MKANTPMSVTSVKFLLEALTCEVDGLSAGLKALTGVKAPVGPRTLIDGPRRVQIGASGVSGAVLYMGSVWICDDVYEFAQDGDSLGTFNHYVNGQPSAGIDRERLLVLERAVREAFGRDTIRAYRAIRILAGLHGIAVPALGRQGVPEAS